MLLPLLSLQSCLTLCDPMDSSPPGSPVPGILQARTLEWVAISLYSAWKWKVKVKSLSRVQLLATSWPAAYQASRSMRFSSHEYWSGAPLPSLILIEWGKRHNGDWYLRGGISVVRSIVYMEYIRNEDLGSIPVCLFKWFLPPSKIYIYIYIYIYIFVFVFGCFGFSMLHTLFSSYGEWGLLYSWSAQASHCGGFLLLNSGSGAWRLQYLQFLGSRPQAQ